MDMLSIEVLEMGGVDISLEKPTSKEALKVLSEKEKFLKEEILRISTKYHISDGEIIRVCAYILNSLKRMK